MLDNDILDEREEVEQEGIPAAPMVSVARVIICLHAFYLIVVKLLNGGWTNFDLLEWLMVLFFVFLKSGFMIYYNVIHAIEESRGTAVTPKFSKAVITLFILILGFQGIGFIRGFIVFMKYDFFNLLLLTSALLILCTISIMYRESKYYNWWKKK